MQFIGFVVLISTLLVGVKCKKDVNFNPKVFKHLCRTFTNTLAVLTTHIGQKLYLHELGEGTGGKLMLLHHRLLECDTACKSIEAIVVPDDIGNQPFIVDAALGPYRKVSESEREQNDVLIFNFIETAFDAVVPLIELSKVVAAIAFVSGDIAGAEKYMESFLARRSGFKMNTTIISISITLILVISNYLFG
ncbi:putative integral membrane protein [Theileria parva strain Muguga]|uniref:Uncharacterized protein n=1 Tax=Theileria parva TaxID=5875 RepID=Q4N0W7_THEPA|nr:putative integral membrane protein [Theileria parva strain Muguga]EAN30869.1 putative integral membrane protein [Theileria parva strain Muguga]|eukprot:XP_763152.1 hypothetical protein [Theileria parva strain Muguga]